MKEGEEFGRVSVILSLPFLEALRGGLPFPYTLWKLWGWVSFSPYTFLEVLRGLPFPLTPSWELWEGFLFPYSVLEV